jgi:hypothetical protein
MWNYQCFLSQDIIANFPSHFELHLPPEVSYIIWMALMEIWRRISLICSNTCLIQFYTWVCVQNWCWKTYVVTIFLLFIKTIKWIVLIFVRLLNFQVQIYYFHFQCLCLPFNLNKQFKLSLCDHFGTDSWLITATTMGMITDSSHT